MSRINNRWFGHETWAKRHKKLLVGLFVITILLFLAVLAHFYRGPILSVMESIRGVEKEEIKKEEPVEQVPEEPVSEEPIVTEKPMIALTFDDGPSIYTDKLLDKLKECDAKATFFVVGDNVRKRPDTLKKMDEMGCEIGNHTYHHVDLTKLTPEEIKAEIDSTNAALQEVLGKETVMVRPTYGAVNDVVIENIPYPLVHWSVDTTDWQTEDGNVVIEHVLNTAKDGDIVLLHDIHSVTVEAMMDLIPQLKEKGFELVTVSELAAARGVTLENQQKYFEFKK